MKRVFLLIFVSALMVTFGFAQTPDAGSNTDPATVKGCLSGSEGNYTIAEDGTRQIFKVTSSSVDLKPHVGHDVKLVGHKASGSVSAGPADHSFAVTDVSMISEHCAAPAAAAAATVAPYAETVIAPDATAKPAAASAPAPDAAAPTATASPSATTASAPAPDAAATVSPSAATASTPAAETPAPAAPAATVSPSSASVSTPAVEAAAPAATASPSSTTVSAPPVETAHAARPSAHARKLSAKQAATATAPAPTASPSSDTVVAENAAPPPTPVSPSPETASPADAAVPAPATPVTHRAGSLPLLIAFVVLVIVLGTTAPLIGRWRKRKILERNGSPNLSFTNEASPNEVRFDEARSDQDKPAPCKVA
jgi:hypothetical protein